MLSNTRLPLNPTLRILSYNILGHPELDMEASDAGIEPMESNDCRGMSINDRDVNDVLATM